MVSVANKKPLAMSEKKGRLDDDAINEEHKAEPAANALWMFMFRFVLASGLLEHDTRRQEERRAKFSAASSASPSSSSSSLSSASSSAEDKGKRKKPHDEDSEAVPVPAPWADFLIEAKLHDPRLTLYVAAFAGPRWVAENPYETEIVRRTEALVGWEKSIAAMKEISQGFEDLKQNPGEPLQRFDEMLSKHQLPSAMGQIRDYVRTTLRGFSKTRPRFNIWKFAADARHVEANHRWVSDWDWEISLRRHRASNALLHEDPWRDARFLDVDGECVAGDRFLIERFWLWDAKLRFADELRALNQTRASKQMHEHGFSAILARRNTKTPSTATHTGESPLVIVEDTETEDADA